jgi:superfamily II DNA or RNA helicase
MARSAESRKIRLRPWQRTALERFEASERPDFLAVATPGAGKTTFALTAARHHLAATTGRARVVVVTPTAHLKVQWARAAAAFDLDLDPAWSPRDGLPGDVHGLVTTYQQVATSARELSAVARDAFVVFDEVHHAADERAWGDSLTEAFTSSRRRLSLSGTPFRSDTRGIPFVRYVAEEAVPDYEYGYGEALADGRVVRPVYFPRIDGAMEWSAPDGAIHSATFADSLTKELSSQRLRTALSLEGEWLPAVLSEANAKLRELRTEQPDAGGLVIAMDQEHARGIARILRERTGAGATVVTSDDPLASARIAQFGASDSPWIVAVRMVSEGVDIPRLRVGVFATTTTTELFFRQAVGRLVRWTAGARRQPAFLFIPDDPRLRARAHQLADLRRHSLRKDDRVVPEADPEALDGQTDEQLSLFAAISAVALGGSEALESPWAPGVEDGADAFADEPDEEHGFEVDLPPLPHRAGMAPSAAPGTRTEHRKRLREENAGTAKELARRTGMGHAMVNAELNRLAGVRKIAEATVDQLERRLRHAETWLQKV